MLARQVLASVLAIDSYLRLEIFLGVAMIRSNWKGTLRLSLVSVPVQAVSANVSGGGEIHVNQLHETCHNRIRYKKFCPVHGEVSNDEIASGYEYAKGRYVILDPEDLKDAAVEAERAINIETFVAPGEIDPLYFDGRSYYLLPDGPAAHKSYAVLTKAMEKSGRFAVARCAMARRPQIALIRPLEHLLVLSVLNYAHELRQPQSLDADVDEIKISAAELKLAEALIGISTSKTFKLAAYSDDYTDRLREVINAKVEGKQIVASPAPSDPPIINLMDALRKSVGHAKPSSRAPRSKGAGQSARRRERHPLRPARRKSS